MAAEQIVEQIPQTAEVMPVDPTNNVQAEQPVSASFDTPALGVSTSMSMTFQIFAHQFVAEIGTTNDHRAHETSRW